jgi:hypothetical protein
MWAALNDTKGPNTRDFVVPFAEKMNGNLNN